MSVSLRPTASLPEGKSSRFAAGRRAELDDVLAVLRRRRENCLAIEKRTSGMEELAADRRRQLEVLIEQFEQGLHHGAAVAAEALRQAQDGALAEGLGE